MTPNNKVHFGVHKILHIEDLRGGTLKVILDETYTHFCVLSPSLPEALWENESPSIQYH